MIQLERKMIAVLLATSFGFFLFVAWLVLPAAPAGFDWDDTWYIWMAEWFSGRREYQKIALSMLQARQYPPFFPFLLSFTGEVLSGIKSGLLMNAAFLASGTFLIMALLVRMGMPAMTAVLGGFLMMFNPVALIFIPSIISEPLFILLTVMAIVVANLDGNNFSNWFIAGLLAGLSVATRSAGWALVAALLVQLVLQKNYRQILFLLPGLATGLFSIFYLKAGLPTAHTYMDGFIENLSNMDWLYLSNQFRATLMGWVQLWGSSSGAVIAAIIVIPGLVIRLVKARPDAWYIVITFIMLIAWPFPEQMSRFLWVLFPAFLLSAQATFERVGNAKHRNMLSFTVMALILMVSIPHGLGRFVERLINPPVTGLNHLSRLSIWTQSEDRKTGQMQLMVNQQFLEDMQRIKDAASGDYCIYSELPALVSIQALKVAYASPWNSLENVRLAGLNCRYYYLIPTALPGVTPAEAEHFAARHHEIFRSIAPYDESGETILGMFLFLFPDETK